MFCTECGVLIETPTHFESETETCFSCIRRNIPKINPKSEIKRPLGKLKCVFCLGTIYTFKPKKGLDRLTNQAVTGVSGVYHPICKNRFMAELEKRGYSLIYEKPKRRRTSPRPKKTPPKIKSLEDMKKWITERTSSQEN